MASKLRPTSQSFLQKNHTIKNAYLTFVLDHPLHMFSYSNLSQDQCFDINEEYTYMLFTTDLFNDLKDYFICKYTSRFYQNHLLTCNNKINDPSVTIDVCNKKTLRDHTLFSCD